MRLHMQAGRVAGRGAQALTARHTVGLAGLAWPGEWRPGGQAAGVSPPGMSLTVGLSRAGALAGTLAGDLAGPHRRHLVETATASPRPRPGFAMPSHPVRRRSPTNFLRRATPQRAYGDGTGGAESSRDQPRSAERSGAEPPSGVAPRKHPPTPPGRPAAAGGKPQTRCAVQFKAAEGGERKEDVAMAWVSPYLYQPLSRREGRVAPPRRTRPADYAGVITQPWRARSASRPSRPGRGRPAAFSE